MDVIGTIGTIQHLIAIQFKNTSEIA